MKVLIVGGGGREHALAWKTARSPRVTKLYCAPGNPGIAAVAECVSIDVSDLEALRNFAVANDIDLTIVGPELPLTLGIVDLFEASGLKVFGPGKEAAQLEGSKIFAKNIMKEAGIPTADFAVFSDPEAAKDYIRSKNSPLVVKADGLAAGKGVFPCRSAEPALEAIDRIMVQLEFGDAGKQVVIEDFLVGEEASFICFTDGETVTPLPSSQDHKPAYDNDEGPNTGGMGAYSPAPVITSELHTTVMDTVLYPLVRTMAARGIPFKGIIYAGLMIDNGIPSVLEFNVRFGDPETQPILFRLESDLIDLMEAAVDGKLAEATIELDSRPAVCVVMASGGYPGSYAKGNVIQGLEQAAAFDNTMVFHAGTSQKNGDILTSGGRVLGVTARGATIKEAIAAAYAAVDTISWNNVQFRKDIGRKAMLR
ncbi:phosphoribosylamine--glycine ligase [Thermodesulfobacteriota bacterium]